MNKKVLIAGCCSLLLLTGCGKSQSTVQGSSDKLMTIGDVTYSKGDVYNLIKESEGSNLIISLALTDIYDKEVPRTDKIKEEAQKQYDEAKAANPDLDNQILSSGYESVDQYIDSVVIPSVQSEELTKKYFEKNEDSIVDEYKPSKAQIIQCDTKDKAQDALKALKEGKNTEDVVKEFGSETAAFTGSEQIVTTLSSTLPTRLINSLSSAKDSGVLDEVFVNDDKTSFYVANLISNNYKDNLDAIVEALSSNSSLSKEITISYLTEYKFEVYDQFLFNQLKINNPEYLVTRPDLAEDSKSDSSN